MYSQTFGFIFGLSDAIIGLTIFAAGNSLADLVANMSVAVRIHSNYIMSRPHVCLGIRPHHGFLGLFRWSNAEHIVRCRHFRLIYNPPDRRTLQAPFLQYPIRKLSGASCASRYDYDIRSYERLFPPAQVGDVPHLLLCSDHDSQCSSGGARTRLGGRCARHPRSRFY